MTLISQFLADDHHRCDNFFAEVEAAVSALKWEEAQHHFGLFREALEHHFTMEEQVLFSAFEEKTGMSGGPTAVMRREHEQMRDLAQMMQLDLDNQDDSSYLGHSEVLNIMMAQHNLKEENVLYQMCDQVLRNEAPRLVDAMKETVDIVNVHY